MEVETVLPPMAHRQLYQMRMVGEQQDLRALTERVQGRERAQGPLIVEMHQQVIEDAMSREAEGLATEDKEYHTARHAWSSEINLGLDRLVPPVAVVKVKS